MTLPSLARLIFDRVSSETMRPGLAPRRSILGGGGGGGEGGVASSSSPPALKGEEETSAAFAATIASCDMDGIGTREACIRAALADRNWGRQGLIGSEEASRAREENFLRKKKTERWSQHVAHSPLFSLNISLAFAMALPVQLPLPLLPGAARPSQARPLSSPALRRAIGNGAKRALAVPQSRQQRQCSNMIVVAAAATLSNDPDAPPPYELDDYTAEANAAYWETRPVAVLKRGLIIGTRVVLFLVEKESRWENRLALPSLARLLLARSQPRLNQPTNQKQTGIEFARWFAIRGFSSAEAARSMRELLTRLGPAFIKVGQALAARPDLLPPDFIAELELLHDRIPPFDDARARALIEEELGAPASQIFSKISATPVAAASLGQVYRATLAVDTRRTAAKGGARNTPPSSPSGPDDVTNGAPPLSTAGPAARSLLSSLPPETPVEVAVKVQRPGVRETIGLDVFILRSAAALLRSAKDVNTDLPALVDEWSSSLFGELDYRIEEANGTLFKSLYGRLDGVYVPSMVPSLCRKRVLVMEWVEGGRLRSASDSVLALERRRESSAAAAAAAGSGSGSSFSAYSSASSASAFSSPAASFSATSPPAVSADAELRLVDVGVRCSLEQMMSVGFFHADPHQGNFIRRSSDGKLAYIDFGMCARIDDATRRALLTASVHLANREFGSLADDMLALGFFPPGTQRSVVAPALTGVFARAMEGGIQSLSFQTLSADLGKTMYDYKFRLPTYATLLVRSLTVLEGIARSADREYPGLLQSAYPWIARRLLQSPSPELRAALRSLLYKGNKFRFDRLESLLLQAARSPPRPAAMVSLAESSSSLNSSSSSKAGADSGGGEGESQVTAAGGALGLLLSPDAAFVREVLVDELAKGLDSGARVAADGARDAVTAAGRSLLGAAASFLPAGSPPRTLLLDPALALQASVDRAIPHASRQEDEEQVGGVLRLAAAMREFSRADAARAGAVRAREGRSSVSSSSSSTSPLSSLLDPEDPNSLLAAWARAVLPSAAGDAARAMAWLAREAVSLPPSAAATAARLPAEVAAKAASRGAARAMRGLAGLRGSGSGGTSSGPSVAYETAAEDERTRSAAEASNVSSSAFASSFLSQRERSKPASAAAAAAAPASMSTSSPPPPRPRAVSPAAAARPAAARPAPPPPQRQQQAPVVVVNGASPVAIAPVAAASFINDDPILKNVIMMELEEP